VDRKSVQRAHGSTTSTISSVASVRNRSDTVNTTVSRSTQVSASKNSSVSRRLRSFFDKNSPKNANKRESTRTFFFSKGRFILRIITEVATLLTFGAVFPPLAVVICVSMFSYTVFMQLLVGRFLTRAQKHRDYSEIRRILENECRGVSTQLIESFGYLIFFAALFYSLFVFDTLGDVNGSAIRTAWIGVLMLIMPGLLYVLWLGAVTVRGTYERCLRYNSARSNKNKLPDNSAVRAKSVTEPSQKRMSGGLVLVAEPAVEVESKENNAVENPIFVGSEQQV
jgi:hypothetical protein